MSYFLSEITLTAGDTITLTGEEAAHLLKARRMRSGERFALQDPSGNRFLAELLERDQRKAIARVLEPITPPSMPKRRLVLMQAAVKDRAAEWIIQKGTELGVAGMIFFPTENSTLSHKQLLADKTLKRWERIAWEACKQCDRQFPPDLHLLTGLEEALATDTSAQSGWLLHPTGKPLATAHLASSPVAAAHPISGSPANSPAEKETIRVLTGPEGGLTAEEISIAQQAGMVPVRIGDLILRAETAALAAAAILLLDG